jgi:hypothetical protein
MVSGEELLAGIAAMTSYRDTRDRLEQEMREHMPWLAQKILDDMKKETEQ